MKTVCEFFGVSLLAIFLVGAVVALLKPERIISEARKAEIEEHVLDFQLDTNQWLRVMEIWHCDDGTYEVRTSLTVHAKVPTLAEAEADRYAWAAEMVQAKKEGRLDVKLQRLPDCGKRIK